MNNMKVQRAQRDRVISKFPPPYKEDSTPYKDTDFHQSVRTACSSNKTGTVGLKVSKAIVVGDVAVGKTCLVQRFCHEIFDRDYKATIGVDFEVERFDILNVPFNLQVWDTAGQERFKCIAAAYYRGAHVVVIVFDLNDGFSLQHCQRWYDEAMKENQSNAHIFLVGAKKDLCNTVQFEAVEKEAIQLAAHLNAEYWSVSSLTGENIEPFFNRVAVLTFNAAVQREIEDMEKNAKAKKIAVAAGGSSLIKLTPDLDGSLDDKSPS
ncbi:ras-related protein Rab-34-like [Amphiura filiformis]|uniref:ras-related protein Rab-34-like n=1 Tax=Amphiura filiformis TaxID=82378 RepID=UPI003B21B810